MNQLNLNASLTASLSSLCIALCAITSGVASATPITSSRVEAWLKDHAGTHRYELTSRDGGRGVIWESIKRASVDEIHLWQAMESVTHRGRPRDQYIVERRRFSAAPPFELIGFDEYRLQEGEAHSVSWRARAREGSSPNMWVINTRAPELRRVDRPDWRRGVMVAERAWRDTALTSKARALEVHETLVDHLNLMFNQEDRRTGYQLSVRGQRLIETRFTISRYDERVTRRRGRWDKTRELKIVDASGDASSVILNDQHQMLALHIGDQVRIVRDGYAPDEVKSRTLMLLAPGRLTQRAASGLRARARSLASSCGAMGRAQNQTQDQARSSSSRRQRLKARLHIAPDGSVDEVSFDLKPRWSDQERCIAERLGSIKLSEHLRERALVSVDLSL